MKPFWTCFLLVFLIACGNSQEQIVQQAVEQAPQAAIVQQSREQAPIVNAPLESRTSSELKEQLMAMPDREPPYMAKITVNLTPVYQQSTGNDTFQILRVGDQVEVIALENGRTQIRTKDYEGWIENGRVEVAE